jgi:ABC-type transport system involved in cytochrome bd biosynthesis fused ATPase/permease subunit
MLKAPPIVLLDEPTEGLDAKNEDVVRKAMIQDRPVGQTVMYAKHKGRYNDNRGRAIFLGFVSLTTRTISTCTITPVGVGVGGAPYVR